MRKNFCVLRVGGIASLLAALGLSLCSSAWAGRPFNTEDAGVIDKGKCEIEAVSEFLRWPYSSEASAPNQRSHSAQLGCGVIEKSELALAWQHATAAGETTRALVLSGKTQFIDGGEERPSVTLAYFIGRDRVAQEPWHSGARGATLVASVPHGAWWLHANLGVIAEQAPRRNLTQWALAFERMGVMQNIDAGFEFFGDDHHHEWAQLGTRWNFKPDRLLFDVALGRELGPKGMVLTSVGLKWIF